MDTPKYRLRCEILAHTNDVRALCVMDSAIISGSRDMSVKLWTQTKGTYEESITMKAHSKFISSVFYLPQSEHFPIGLIVTGGHDHKIFGFIPFEYEPLFCLEGHTGPVCCLARSTIIDFFLSSSWDCSAKLWDPIKRQCMFTIYGHTETVWAVIHIPFDNIITGSADHSINVHSSVGAFKRKLSGHTDCVRGLSYLHETLIVSCSNDGTVRTWDVSDGSCLNVQELHSSYIYSIKTVYDQNLIVAGCEDKILTIIHNGCQQDITLPAQSVWAVDILPNCDVVAGSSDGYIRIFSSSSSRQSSSDDLQYSEKHINEPPQSFPVEPIPCVSLGGTIDGTFDGQLKFVKVLGTIKCYKWSMDKNNWFSLEELNSKSDLLNKKIAYEGQEYDHIFYIHIEGECTSPLKLPFNTGEDPLIVGMEFIKKHNLDPLFTDSIVGFLNNKTTKSSGDFMDVEEVTSTTVRKFYPPDNYIFFQNFEETRVKQRLDEFWMKQQLDPYDPLLNYMKSLTLPDELIDKYSAKCGIREMIKCIDIWPESIIYPVLDIARISLLRPKVSSIMFENQIYASEFWKVIVKYMQEDSSSNNKMLVCRIMCNMFSTEEGINFIFDRKEFIFSHLPMSAFSEKHRGFEISLASLFVNLTLGAIKRKDKIAIVISLEIIQKILMLVKEEEAVFRLLVALGTLSLYDDKIVIGDDVFSFLYNIETWKERSDDSSIKASQCAKNLIADNVSLVLERNKI